MTVCVEANKTMKSTPAYDAIDDVLYEWFRWTSGYGETHGYSSSDATCRDFKSNRQWMDHSDLSDLVDYQLRKRKGELVDPIISKLGLRHRIAVNMAMRNMNCGYSVWSSIRSGTQEQDYREAKEIMRPSLVARGLVNG